MEEISSGRIELQLEWDPDAPPRYEVFATVECVELRQRHGARHSTVRSPRPVLRLFFMVGNGYIVSIFNSKIKTPRPPTAAEPQESPDQHDHHDRRREPLHARLSLSDDPNPSALNNSCNRMYL